MTMQENYKDEWLDRAFRLAYFLHGRRETAKRIAASAMNKLETASNAQYKRYYYTPTGRAENSRAARSRVSLNDLQLLQRLVFVESEIFERECEATGKTNEESLLKFFIKHLVRISLKRNSFYVTLAVSRILHNYPTADAMEIYNVVVQDPERVHDDYYYRSRKGVLMKELKERFGALLETVKVNRGEERFKTCTDTENLNETARDALKFFTPWKSACAIPEKFDPFADILKPFYFDKNDPDEEHRIEINRIHAAIHPCCFTRLTGALNLPVPEKKLEIPKFMTTAGNQTNLDNNDWRNPPSLEADELRQIKDILTAQAESRKALTAGFLRVTADGAQRARINLTETDSAKFDLDAGAELIEIYGAGEKGETLLATHLLNFDELRRGDQTQTILLEGGQKITFNLAPKLDEFGEVAEINCAVNYAETAWQKRLALALRRAKFAARNLFAQPVLKPAMAFGLILLALTLGWIVFRNFGEAEKIQVKNPPPQIKPEENKIPAPAPPEEKKELTKENDSPENLKQANPAQPKQPEIVKNPKREIKKEVSPKKENPVAPPQNEVANKNRNSRRDETDENGILRLPIRESNQRSPEFEPRREREGASRNFTRKIEGKSLAEIRTVYIEISGDAVLGNELAAQIAAELGKFGRFQITSDKEQADAALKIYVRHESDGDTRDDASIAAVVRLVNEKGFVVYPNKKGISGWKYVGTMAKLPSRIVIDLAKAKK